jgi:hypothetical protein
MPVARRAVLSLSTIGLLWRAAPGLAEEVTRRLSASATVANPDDDQVGTGRTG